MPKQSKGERRCASPTCLNEPCKSRKYCEKCRKRQWREKNQEKATYGNLVSNSKRRRIPVTLTFEEFVKEVVDTAYMRRKGTSADSLTIDRKIPYLGYRAGNLQIMTLVENIKKYRKFDVWHKEPLKSKEEEGTPF